MSAETAATGGTGATDSPAIAVANFAKRYGRREAVRGVSLAVGRGEIFGLIGPDGAGKSSLMKAVAGVLAYDAGSVEVFGVRIDSERAAERVKARIGFMPQGLGLNLYPDLSIEENVDFFGQLRLVPKAELARRKDQLLAMTHLTPFRNRPMKQLSGGMKQKLGLVCALIHEPDLIILDEPTTGVDPVSRRDFWAILGHLIAERGMSAMVSTAYMDEADRFDRIALFYDGRVLAEGRPAEIVAREPGARELEEVFVATLRRQGVHAEDWRSPGDRPAAAGAAAIEASGLTRAFGDFRAADAVSFRVEPGEIFGLLGANGAGKTTVIKMLTGILPPSAGEGRVAGADMREAPQAIKERIGYMSQAFSLYHDLSVLENIRLYAGIYGLDRREARRRSEWIVTMAGLAGYENDRAGRLPMGLRQRLALGCALVHKPRVLFLDEPTSGVDPIGRRAFWNILFRLSREDGVAILVTTHYMAEAELCDRLALMFAGRVVADASPAAMKAAVEAEAGRLLEIEVDRPAAALAALAEAGYADAALHGRRLHVLTPAFDADRERLPRLLAAAGVGVGAAGGRPLSMEDVFVHRVTALERAAAGARP